MPIYTYRCENCGVQFERQQHFDEQQLTWCPECNKKALRKVYTPVGIVFKGSGFYSTDHRSPSGAGRLNSSKSESGEKKSETPAKETNTSTSTSTTSSSSEKSEK
jgi:putative FmdB family regulatory protein